MLRNVISILETLLYLALICLILYKGWGVLNKSAWDSADVLLLVVSAAVLREARIQLLD